VKLKQRTEDDSRLFREAMRDVKPLRMSDRHVPPPRRARVRARPKPLPLEDLPPVAGDDLHFHRPGIQNSVVRDLRRGRYPVEAEIDLHGMRLAEAEHALRDFLASALRHRCRCIRVVHGKGLRSGGSVLRPSVAAILRRTSAVMAYVSAPEAHGGSGALNVLLKT
jgi:DNA-nicking Smr family endonuclease